MTVGVFFFSGNCPSAFHEKADPCQECFCAFRDFLHFFRSAKPPLSPPFHPHSYMSGFRSVPVGCSRFIRRCHLGIVLFFLL